MLVGRSVAQASKWLAVNERRNNVEPRRKCQLSLNRLGNTKILTLSRQNNLRDPRHCLTP
jgi:hypothetical protein